ncbi:MAG TPA: hypothetical protein PLF81_04335 [Candidatus Anammoximicrobium sp.]|nr:hypothetical protein [Candidatus Anammoximicrobium sp.]
MNDLLQNLQRLPDAALFWGGMLAAVVVLWLVVILFLLLRRRARQPELALPDLRIDVAALPDRGPPSDGPRLEFYGTPVRLAVLVLAPAGRNNPLPAERDLPAVLDDLLLDFTIIVATHRPLIRLWPCQLSTQGFVNSFFNNARLPGDRGKGTPWCAVAGRFEAGDQQLLAGLVCAADRPNSLGQMTVEHVGQWMDVLRVKQVD